MSQHLCLLSSDNVKAWLSFGNCIVFQQEEMVLQFSEQSTMNVEWSYK